MSSRSRVCVCGGWGALTSRSLNKVKLVLCKTLDQCLTTVQISKGSIKGLKRYGSLKTLQPKHPIRPPTPG